MTFGLLDLSIVTDRLVSQLKDYKDTSPLWTEDNTAPAPGSINVTGLAPDAARKVAGCQLSVYLFQVAVDRFHRNTYPAGGSAQRLPEQPLALTLYFLVTAFSDTAVKAYIEEQQAMSIALKFFHEHPRITATVPNREEELTITFESQTPAEMGQLWQALSSSLRLSAVYRAAVAFIEPPEPKAPEKVRTYALDVVPSPILATVNAPGGRATVVLAGAGLGATTATQFHNAPLVLTAIDPAPGQFRVTDDHTLVVQVPVGTAARGHLLLVRPAAERPTIAVWLVVT